jgi:hypothetical protein
VAQVPLTEDDDMVEAFPPERANHPFRMPVLPGRARRNEPVTTAHSSQPPGENFAINRVTIASRSTAIERVPFSVQGCNSSV